MIINQTFVLQVTARGSPDVPLLWPFDLQLSLTKMMGRLCGATLNANPRKLNLEVNILNMNKDEKILFYNMETYNRK